MAFVIRDTRQRSPFWYAAFRGATGRWLKKSTKQTSKSKALELARAWEKASGQARQKSLTEARTREILSEILESVNGEGLHIFTVAEWFDHFVNQKKKSRADKTATRHGQMMREFIDFLGARANLNIATVTSPDIAGFRDHRQSLGLAPSTLNVDITVLSAAFNSALRQGHISVNPCAEIEDVKDSAERKHTFLPEQVSALVESANKLAQSGKRQENPWRDWPGLILAAFYTGQRLGDCANIQWKHVDLVSEIKTIRFAPRKDGGGKTVVIVAHPVLEDFLLSLPAPKSDDEFVFPSLAQRKISPLSKAFKKIMTQARIANSVIRKRSESGSGRNVNALTFHSLRHSFTSILANAGISEELRMALTGHVSRDIHQGYTHHELARLRDAIGVLPRI
jgi:integrase